VHGTYTPCQTEVISGGTRRCKPEAPIAGYYPRIIDDKLWHEAQARLAEVHPRGKAATKPVRNVLQGLCRCTVCGGEHGHGIRGWNEYFAMSVSDGCLWVL
jgi:hypothetical protein